MADFGPRITAIQLAVASSFGILAEDLARNSKRRDVVVPRQIAMYLAKQLTEASLTEIGQRFGGKHHTTVMHSISKVEAIRKSDEAIDRLVKKLMVPLSGPCAQAVTVTTGFMKEFLAKYIDAHPPVVIRISHLLLALPVPPRLCCIHSPEKLISHLR